jgi:hypothetical protein
LLWVFNLLLLESAVIVKSMVSSNLVILATQLWGTVVTVTAFSGGSGSIRPAFRGERFAPVSPVHPHHRHTFYENNMMVMRSPTRRSVLLSAGMFGGIFGGDNKASSAPLGGGSYKSKGPSNELVKIVDGMGHKRLGGSDIIVSDLGLGTQRWLVPFIETKSLFCFDTCPLLFLLCVTCSFAFKVFR